MNVIISNKYKEMLMSLDIEVIKSLEGVFDADEIISQFSNFYFDRMILDITAIRDYHNTDNLQKLSINLDMSKVILLLDDDEESSSRSYLSKLISMGIYNFTRNTEGIKYLLQNPNSYRDVAHIHDVNQVEASNETTQSSVMPETEVVRSKIIGVKSLTSGAGATTLTYVMKKQLEENYDVAAIEVDKTDFKFFDDKELVSTTSDYLAKELMKKNDKNIILVDLNNCEDSDVCSEIIYLVEPSTVKLNRLMMANKGIFENNPNRKIVLNKSNIKQSELSEFEYETKAKVFFNLPSIDERSLPNNKVNELLSKLGFVKQNVSADDGSENKNKLLGMFKF